MAVQATQSSPSATTKNRGTAPHRARFRGLVRPGAVPYLLLVPAEAAYETNVGNAVNALVAQAATGKAVTDADVKAALQEAQDKMASAGS